MKELVNLSVKNQYVNELVVALTNSGYGVQVEGGSESLVGLFSGSTPATVHVFTNSEETVAEAVQTLLVSKGADAPKPEAPDYKINPKKLGEYVRETYVSQGGMIKVSASDLTNRTQPTVEVPFKNVYQQIMHYIGMANLNPDKAKSKKPARVYFLRDKSGSMGEWGVGNAFAIAYWMRQVFELLFEDVKFEYVCYDVEAESVTLSEFQTRGTSVGTVVSRGYAKVLEHIKENCKLGDKVFVYNFTDGDNLTSDNAKVLTLLRDELAPICAMLGEVEFNQYNRTTNLATAWKNINVTNTCRLNIGKSSEVLDAIKTLVNHVWGHM